LACVVITGDDNLGCAWNPTAGTCVAKATIVTAFPTKAESAAECHYIHDFKLATDIYNDNLADLVVTDVEFSENVVRATQAANYAGQVVAAQGKTLYEAGMLFKARNENPYCVQNRCSCPATINLCPSRMGAVRLAGVGGLGRVEAAPMTQAEKRVAEEECDDKIAGNTLRAACKSAVCETLAMTAASKMREGGAISRLEIFGFQYAPQSGHMVMVVGRADGSDTRDPTTWGTKVFILDAWYKNLAMKTDAMHTLYASEPANDLLAYAQSEIRDSVPSTDACPDVVDELAPARLIRCNTFATTHAIVKVMYDSTWA